MRSTFLEKSTQAVIVTYDTKECFRTRLKTRSTHGEYSWWSQVQAWYKPGHAVSAKRYAHMLVWTAPNSTHICLFSPSLDCTVAMMSRRNIPLRVTGITLAAIMSSASSHIRRRSKLPTIWEKWNTSQSKSLPAHGTTNAIAKLVESHQH